MRIGADDSVTILLKHSEMGQGVATSLAMVLAEELGCDWSKVRVEHAPADLAYVHTVFQAQMTGGSTLIALEIEGGKAGAFRFLNALELIRISNNLGDAKSLITHPATTTHQRFTPEERAEIPRRELAKLRRRIETSYDDPADRALATCADRQGLGSRKAG